MGFIEALTLILITLKLLGFISSWSWFLILLPEAIVLIFYIIIAIIYFCVFFKQ